MEIIGKHHNEWVSIVRSFGGGIYSEDIVQETYIRIHKANSIDNAVKGDKVNKGFMWVALRNNYINYSKQRAKVHKIELKEYHMKTRIEDLEPRFTANDIMDIKIHKEMESWHWYDRDIFKLITSKKVSMRKFSRDSRISLSSLSNTMNKCKRRLKAVIGEDYEDYLNKDYKKII